MENVLIGLRLRLRLSSVVKFKETALILAGHGSTKNRDSSRHTRETAKRLQNQGHSGWWVLGLIVPILNIAVSVKCIAAPEGYADHKTLDTSGKIVVGLLLAAIVLTVAAIALA